MILDLNTAQQALAAETQPAPEATVTRRNGSPGASSGLPAPENQDDPEKTARRRAAVQTFLLPVLAILLLCFVWEGYSKRADVTLPGPVQTVTESWQYIAHPFFDNGPNDKGLGWQLWASLQRVAQGYFYAAIAGILFGILIGKSVIAYKALDPIFQVLRTIPPLAWLPLSLATFNQANPSAIFVIFITAVWPILINTSVGVMRIPSDYQNVARVYQIRRARYFFLVLIPAAAPYIFTGLRIAIGMAWLAIVAAEMLTGGVGIGFFIWDSWNSSRMSDIVVSVVYVGLVGLLLDRLIAGLARLFGTRLD
jgi:nitrate/nitrite transport system permease protein